VKGWNGFLLLATALGLLMTAACTKGVSQTEYDKVKTDLATAQASLQSLQNDYNSAMADRDKARADLATAQARVQSLQNDYNSATADRDKARADLATAQARAQKLEGDLSLVQAQAKDLQTQLDSAKASLDMTKTDYDKAKTDLATAQARVQELENDLALTQASERLTGSLGTFQCYAKVTDLLFVDSYRQGLGLEPEYKYTDAQLRAEVSKAVEASNDPLLQALWNMGATEGPLESFGVVMLVYDAVALNSVGSGEGTPAVFPPAPLAVNPSPTGQTLLQVKLVSVDGSPISSVEVALWRDASALDPPDAGVARTDASGIASFTVKEGAYWIDFNPANPPMDFTISSGRVVLVVPGMATQVEIAVFNM
jgi:outer membrane murein-binding lipoprotein Lpp